LATECLKIAQAVARSRDTLPRCRIQQHSSLITIFRNSVAAEVKIREQQCGLTIVLGN
jgi:hypothetical protein